MDIFDEADYFILRNEYRSAFNDCYYIYRDRRTKKNKESQKLLDEKSAQLSLLEEKLMLKMFNEYLYPVLSKIVFEYSKSAFFRHVYSDS